MRAILSQRHIYERVQKPHSAANSLFSIAPDIILPHNIQVITNTMKYK